MNSATRRPGVLLIAIAVLLLSTSRAEAQSTNRQIGTQFTVTADPLVPRPHVRPCVVPLFNHFRFAFFSDTTQTFSFTPPENCAGPWQKVVFEINFSENAGSQFDRTASVYIANANLYFGTTPEPVSNDTNTWHIERDVTDYGALLQGPHQGTIVLQNCTTDCPPPFQFLNGVFTVSAELQFYPAAGNSPGARTADMVLPLEQSNGQGGVNLPAFLFTPTDTLETTFNLPQNIERAYLDVVAQSQFIDEQWYACFPNDLSAINLFYGCGNTDFRETEVTIDGHPAGIAPISPWVFTGFLPDQWQPIPAAQTLDFVPYRVNLTPFASLLDNGSPHTIALSIFNDDNYFSTAASLLLYLDAGSSHNTGAVTENTLSRPSLVIREHLEGTSTVTGTIGVTSARSFTIAGYLHTSHGRVSTSISQKQNFSGTQTIDFDTVAQSVLDQNTEVKTSIDSSTTVADERGVEVTHDTYRFPISVKATFPVPGSAFGFTVDTSQNYQSSRSVTNNDIPTAFTATTNSVNASDVSANSSSQQYTFIDSGGRFYDCGIRSEKNVLTSVSKGCQ